MITKIGKGMHGLKKVLLSVFAVAMFATGSLLLSACGDTTFEVSLNFMVDGGLYATVTTTGNETVSLPENPTKAHYDFDAWYWDEGTWQNPLTANSIMDEPAKNGMSVYAHFTPTHYSITYNDGGDSNPNATYYTIEDSVSLETPTKDGYNFLGWYDNSELTGTPITAITFETYQGESVQVWGSWEVKTSTITFVTNCDTTLNSITAQYGTEITIPTNLTKDYYTFAGWYTDSNFTTPFTSTTMPAESVTLYAKWTATPYTITYVTNGGSQASLSQTYTVEEELTLPTPTKNAYTFAGWYDNSNLTGTPITAISKGSHGDLTLYAAWTATPYTITYELDGATNSNSNPRTYTIETDTITLVEPTKTYYTFIGWYTEYDETTETYSNKVETIEKGSFGDLTLHAKWALTYSITYELYDGTNSTSNPSTYTIESDTITFVEPTRTGYTFGGWFKESTFENSITEIAAGSYGDLTIYAKWTATPYTITYTLNGGEIDTETYTFVSYDSDSEKYSTSYTIESATITLPTAPTKTGHSFAGWYIDKNFTKSVTEVATGTYGNLTYYAKWTINKYTITFNSNGGSEVSAITQDYATEVTAPTDPTKNGYTFGGWFSDSELESAYEFSTIPAEDITLYAKWTATPYTITYTLNGGAIDTETYTFVSYDSDSGKYTTSYTIESSTITLPTPIKNGYTFAGWFKSEEFDGDAITTVDNGSTGSKTLYASWTATPYDINYLNLTNGTNSNSNPNTYTIESATITLADATANNGYTFGGWYDNEDFDGDAITTIDNGSTGDVTLYAKLTATPYTITYTLNGGAIDTATYTFVSYDSEGEKFTTSYTIESSTITLPTPTKNGYTFEGWFDNSNLTGTAITTIDNGSTGNKTLYAKWTATPYEIDYLNLTNGTNSNSNPNTYTIESATITLADATANNGYTFVGWYSEYDEETDTFSNPITQITQGSMGDVTLYAKLTANEYSVSYVTDGTNPNSNVEKYTIETDYELLNSAKDDYTFVGWYTEYDEETDTYSNKITNLKGSFGNLTLYARFAYGTEGLVYSYDSTTSTASVTGYTGTATSVIIPAGFDGYEITSIAASAFSGCSSLTSIVVPDTVTSIGSGAFSGCSSLESITLPFVGGSSDATSASSSTLFGYIFGTTSYSGGTSTKQYYSSSYTTYYIPTTLKSVTIIGGSILYGAFYNCTSLTSITIPDSVTSIGNYAFYYCTSLTSITIPSTVTSIGSGAFAGCSSLESITLPFVGGSSDATSASASTLFGYIFGTSSYTGGTSTTQYYASSSYKTYYIPNTLTSVTITGESILYGAFYNCTNLTSVTIGSGVTSIGSYAFYNCTSLTSVYITDLNAWCDISFGSNYSNPMYYATNLYLNNAIITGEITLSSSVTSIPYGTFKNSIITSITIPDSVTSIGSYTFYNCTSLTSVTIGSGVTSIGTCAFSGCSAEIKWGDNPSITEIGSYSFSGYIGTSITIPNCVTSIGNYTFYNCTSLTSITIPNSVTSIGSYAFSGCSAKIEWVDSPSITEIGSYSFSGYNGTSITIPNSVTSIGSYAFDNCTGLTSVTIGSGVTSIGNSAFYNCTALTEINFNATEMSDLSLSNNVFYKAGQSGDGITVNIGANVTKIPAYLFYPYSNSSYTPNITSVVFAEGSVCTSIGNYAFYNCTALTEINFNATTMSDLYSSNYAFAYAGQSGDGITVNIGANVTKIPAYLFNPCSSSTYAPKITSVVFAENSACTSIGNYAFYYCTSLTSVTIGNGVTSIGTYAFYNCTALNELNFNATEMVDLSSSNYVFYNAGQSGDGITVNIGANVTKIPAYLFNPDFSSSSAKIISVVFAQNSVCTSIGEYAFWYCTGLTSITIPDSVTSIGEYAFRYCTGLTSITIPDSVTSIGSYAFDDCSSLNSVCITDLEAWCNISFGNDYSNPMYYAANLYLNNAIITGDITLGSSVTSIPYGTFKNSTITSITIPTSVTSIGSYAFYGCSAEIKWGDDPSITEIGSYVFAGYNGTSITIPDSVTSIGEYAFYNCTSLTSITIPDSVTSIGYSAFYYCTGLTSVTIGDSVTSIGYSAFRYCTSLTSITIPTSVTSIGGHAFEYCTSLTNVTIGNEVTNIGYSAFYYCTGLTAVYVDNIEMWLGFSFGDFYANPLYYAGNLYVLDDDETNYILLTEITIPDGVSTINAYAFYGCSAQIKWGDSPSITEIGSYAFAGYNGTSITIPDSVTSIGTYAFYYCKSLTSIIIPDSVTSIGDNAFRACTSLTNVTIGSEVTSIGSLAFYGCYKLVEVINLSELEITADSTDNGYVAYYAKGVLTSTEENSIIDTTVDGFQFITIDGTNYLVGYTGTATELTLPDYYDSDATYAIYDYAFYNYTSLTSITIPNSVTSIGSHAFSGCSAEIKWGDNPGITEIGSYAFDGYNGTSITIPDGVATIGDWAFSGCTSLTSITIPDSVTSIGSYAFSYCTSLTSVTIGSGVTSIGDSAFYGCTGLTTVSVDSVETWLGISFGNGYANPLYYARNLYVLDNDGTNYTLLTEITIPDNVTSIGSYAFYGCTSLTTITIPNSVTSIGSYAFSGCSAEIKWGDNPGITKIGSYAFAGYNGTSITIPDSVTSIGDHAFYGCTSLTSVTIGSGVTSIGDWAFYGCTNLTSIIVNSDNTSYKSIDGNLYSYDGTTLIAYAIGKTDTSFTIPDSVTSIGSYAFYGCSAEIKWGDNPSITEIGSYAFAGYNGTSITIPDSVTSIGSYAFFGCTNLTTVTIPNSVISIGEGSFFNCTSLTSVTIGSGVTSIGSYAFYQCSNLTKATLKTTSGWVAGSTSISSSNLNNTITAAAYLRSTYCSYTWTRS